MSVDAQVAQPDAVTPSTWQDAKLRLQVGTHLVRLNGVFDPDTINVLRACANHGHYLHLYHRLLRIWDFSRHSDNTDLINLIILSGKAAGCSADEIAEAMC